MSFENFPTHSQEEDGQMTIWGLEGINDKKDGNDGEIKKDNSSEKPMETLTTLGPDITEEQEDALEKGPSEEEPATTVNPKNRRVVNDVEKKPSEKKPWYEKDPLALKMYGVIKDIGEGRPITMWEIYSRLQKRGVNTTTSQISKLAKEYLIFNDKRGGKNIYSGWNTEKHPPKPTEEPEYTNNYIVQDPRTGKDIETVSERREDWWNKGPIISPSDAYHRQELNKELRDEKRREEEEKIKRREQGKQNEEE